MKLEIMVKGEKAWCETAIKPLTTGTRGIVAGFTFIGTDWDDLIKNAVFSGSGKTIVMLNIGNEVKVPWECLESESLLRIGVEGRRGDGTIVFPTVFANCGEIVRGCDDTQGSEGTVPTPTEVEQLQAEIVANAENIATNAGNIDALTEEVATHDHDIATLKTSKASTASLAQTNSKLDAEITRATNAETLLEQSDIILGNKIDAEAEERMSADQALDTRVTALEEGGGGHGGGSTVTVRPILTSGTKVAEINVNGNEFDLFAPPAGMTRKILRLVAVGTGWEIRDYYTAQTLTFDAVKGYISDVSNYVVCVYGNSKLRPQYVSTNELMMIGLDRASSEAKILRILMTPTSTAYQTFALAGKEDLTSGVRDVIIGGNSVVTGGVAVIPVWDGSVSE